MLCLFNISRESLTETFDSADEDVGSDHEMEDELHNFSLNMRIDKPREVLLNLVPLSSQGFPF